MALRLTTYGGADTVTGSNFLIEGEKGKVVIDCGVFQGVDYCETCTFDPFPYDPKTIDAVVITHAHLDHVGRLPRLVREGFAGSIYMTAPTRDLAEAILYDSSHILEMTARERGLAPLYDNQDVAETLSQVSVLGYHTEKEIAPGLSVYLRNTGHILGSASVRIKDHDSSLAITSDIGNSPTVLLPDAEPIHDADAILIESVYGDRANPEKEHRVEKLRETLKKAIQRGGTIIMPSFSIERTQLMLYEISNFFEAKELPTIPVFLDSPLAIAVTDIYRKWGKEYFNEEAKKELKHEQDLFNFPFLKQTRSREESAEIAKVHGPKIIIAGAGMSHGGRISRWEQRYLPDPKTTLVIVGYQAPGSPGRMLQDGAPRVRIDKEWVNVKAKVETLHGWSGHADRDGLVRFAESCTGAKAFLVGLGEPASQRFLAQRIHDYLGVKAMVCVEGGKFKISENGIRRFES